MAVLQSEAERFERAIVTSSSEAGRQGITLLPGVTSVMEEVPYAPIFQLYHIQHYLTACLGAFLTETLLGHLHIRNAPLRYLCAQDRRRSHT